MISSFQSLTRYPSHIMYYIAISKIHKNIFFLIKSLINLYFYGNCPESNSAHGKFVQLACVKAPVIMLFNIRKLHTLLAEHSLNLNMLQTLAIITLTRN